MDVTDLVAGGRVAVSVDADFFTEKAEQELLADLAGWLTASVADGVRTVFRENHVDLVDLLDGPFDVVLNLDFHMDLRLEFLLGAPALTPPQDASVFETVVASGRTRHYVWVHPESRRSEVAWVYASAVLADRQPLLRAVHCIPGSEALPLLVGADVESVFVCRSPGYASPATDAAFARLRAAAAPASVGR